MERVQAILQLVVHYFEAVAVLIVLPLLAFLAFWSFRSYRRGRRLRASVLGIGILALIALSVAAFRHQPLVQYRAHRFWQPAGLAAAIGLYHSQHQSLPQSLGPLEAGRYFGHVPYQKPLPWYLPVEKWDAQTEFILAVEARTKHTAARRAYVVAGRTDAQWADDEALADLLAKDDALRRSHNQPRLWDFVPWRQTVPVD